MRKEIRKIPESITDLGKISFTLEDNKSIDIDEFFKFNDFQLVNMFRSYKLYEESLVLYDKYKNITNVDDLMRELDFDNGGFLEESVRLARTLRYNKEEIFDQYTDLELATSIFTNLIIKTYIELVEWIDRIPKIKQFEIDSRFKVDVKGVIEIDDYRYLLIRYIEDGESTSPLLVEFNGSIDELKELALLLRI